MQFRVRALAWLAAAALLVPLAAGPPAAASPATPAARTTSVIRTASVTRTAPAINATSERRTTLVTHTTPATSVRPAARGARARSLPIPPPQHTGTLRIRGAVRGGAAVTAAGLGWHAPRLPRGMRLLSFEVAYSWHSCAAGGQHCRAGADTTATPFAARRYLAGTADAGRRLRLTETATEVVETQVATSSFQVIRRSVSRLSATAARAYPRHEPPVTAFINGTPERRTASAEEYFQVGVPHANPADGRVAQWYRIDRGGWRPMPGSRVFYTGQLGIGPHQASVRTANRAGTTEVSFRWQVVPLPAPLACLARPGQPCWYPPHLARDHRPMRWDWQIGRVTPLERTGKHAVDLYDVDGFLTTPAEVRAIRTRWQASTLAHPKAICYLDLAWEDYRPDASPSPRGGYFPVATLGNVYDGYPEERWLDFRQLDALKPMLAERIGMCARKGFDAVELDDIDSFDPPSTTGFRLTPGDAENFLAWAFNEIHRDGMTGLWKNSPWLSWWGRRYADGAVVEECYASHSCSAAPLLGSRQYGITCTALRGAAPCGWDDFSTDVTPQQPGGKWVGEAEYSADHYVCDPGRRCPGPHAFAAFCHAVWAPSGGFAAVKFDVSLDGGTFFPCPRGT